jgi:rRNA-processing protein FCF1
MRKRSRIKRSGNIIIYGKDKGLKKELSKINGVEMISV